MAAKSKAAKTKKPDEPYEEFAKAVDLVQEKKFAQAESALDKLLKAHQDDLRLGAAIDVYRRICRSRTQERSEADDDVENLYDRGVYQHNRGEHDKAMKYFEAARKSPGGDAAHIWYAMAACEARAGREKEALANLAKAVELDSEWRFHAGGDVDFSSLKSSQAFKDLLKSD